MKKTKLLTKAIDRDLKNIKTKNPAEWDKVKQALVQLEESGRNYPGKKERNYQAIKTKYYRILYTFYDNNIICLVCLKKQGPKIENRYFDLADKRLKKILQK